MTKLNKSDIMITMSRISRPIYFNIMVSEIINSSRLFFFATKLPRDHLSVNDVIKQHPVEAATFLSADIVEEQSTAVDFITEFLNSITPNGTTLLRLS